MPVEKGRAPGREVPCTQDGCLVPQRAVGRAPKEPTVVSKGEATFTKEMGAACVRVCAHTCVAKLSVTGVRPGPGNRADTRGQHGSEGRRGPRDKPAWGSVVEPG